MVLSVKSHFKKNIDTTFSLLVEKTKRLRARHPCGLRKAPSTFAQFIADFNVAECATFRLAYVPQLVFNFVLY